MGLSDDEEFDTERHGRLTINDIALEFPRMPHTTNNLIPSPDFRPSHWLRTQSWRNRTLGPTIVLKFREEHYQTKVPI